MDPEGQVLRAPVRTPWQLCIRAYQATTRPILRKVLIFGPVIGLLVTLGMFLHRWANPHMAVSTAVRLCVAGVMAKELAPSYMQDDEETELGQVHHM